MKKFYFKIFAVLIFLLVFSNLDAYQFTRTRLYMTTTNGYSFDKLVFGINEKATNSLDVDLGENEAPPFPPPDGKGINAGFIIYDTTQKTNIWTYLDLRPYPSADTSWVLFKINVLTGSSEVLTFNWNPIGGEIDSIYLIDILTMGQMVNIDMKSNDKVTMPNEYFREFLIKVKYPSGLAVFETENKANAELSPNPASDILKLTASEYIENIKITDILGRECMNKSINSLSDVLNISELQPGIYTIIINYQNSTSFVKKFIKL